ncbi:hypothetical protein FACS189419_01480 [Planctomycetales bacterium]|nr:hypothetical protein FACS189419_01480 [Planctomycetales bacterium]
MSSATNGTEIYYEKSIAYPLQHGKTDWEVRLYEESDKYYLGARKISSKDMGRETNSVNLVWTLCRTGIMEILATIVIRLIEIGTMN